jgi:ribosomal protein S27E
MSSLATQWSLRSFADLVVNLQPTQRTSGNLLDYLSRVSGLTKSQINKFLDELDFKYIRVRWNGKRSAVSFEVLRTDISDLSEKDEEQVSSRSLTAVCSNCGNTKKIVAKNICAVCYSKTRRKIICKVCGHQRPLAAKNMCYPCYHKIMAIERKKRRNPAPLESFPNWRSVIQAVPWQSIAE